MKLEHWGFYFDRGAVRWPFQATFRGVWSDLCQVCNRSMKVAPVCEETVVFRMYGLKLSSVSPPCFRLISLLRLSLLFWGFFFKSVDPDPLGGESCRQRQYSCVGPLDAVRWPFHSGVGSSCVQNWMKSSDLSTWLHFTTKDKPQKNKHFLIT